MLTDSQKGWVIHGLPVSEVSRMFAQWLRGRGDRASGRKWWQAEGISVAQGPEVGLSKGARKQESEVSGAWRLDMNGSGVKGDSKTTMVPPSTLPECRLHEAQALYT